MLFVQQLEVSGAVSWKVHKHSDAADARQVCFNKHKQHWSVVALCILAQWSQHIPLGPEFTHSDLMELEMLLPLRPQVSVGWWRCFCCLADYCQCWAVAPAQAFVSGQHVTAFYSEWFWQKLDKTQWCIVALAASIISTPIWRLELVNQEIWLNVTDRRFVQSPSMFCPLFSKRMGSLPDGYLRYTQMIWEAFCLACRVTITSNYLHVNIFTRHFMFLHKPQLVVTRPCFSTTGR